MTGLNLGENVRIHTNKGREIEGEIVGVGATGEVLVESAGIPTRWYPGHWVIEVVAR